MGKKRVQKKTKEDILAEKDEVDKALEKTLKTKVKRKVEEGKIYINSSYTNILMSLTDMNGNVLASTSAGALGFKGTKKSTSYAASKTTEVLVRKAEKIGVKKVHIVVKGIGAGRIASLKNIVNFPIEILSVRDETPIPHNGCRPRKARRV